MNLPVKPAVLLAVIMGFAQVSVISAQQVEKRVGRLENRVDRVEGRVSRLEEAGGRTPENAGEDNLKAQPLSVTLESRKQLIESNRVGLKLVLSFKNLTNYTLAGFSGKLVFKIEDGGIYVRKIAYSHPVEAGVKARINLVISGDDTKSYLKFVRAKAIKVVFVEQRLY